MSLIKKDFIRFEGYTIDRRSWSLKWQDESIALSGKTFDLLIYLVDHQGEVLSKDHLLAALWPKQVVEESNLTQQVFLLRKALSRHASAGRLIENIPGRGYRFLATIEADLEPQRSVHDAVVHSIRSTTSIVVEEEIADDGPNPPVNSTLPRLTAPRRSLALGAAALAGLLGIIAFAWYYWEHQTVTNPVTIVIGNFEGTGDPQSDRALSDAARIDLGQSPILSVLSRGQTMATLQNMNRSEDTLTPELAREVCERNSAQVVVRGNVSKFGHRYLVSLQANGCVITSNSSSTNSEGEVLASMTETVEDMDGLPHAIDLLAARIRKSLGESRASIRRFDKELVNVKTGSLAALKAYSEGLRFGYMGDYPHCLALFQHAIELDPNFGAVYLDIVNAFYNLQDNEKARQAILVAYEHRDSMSEKQRLTTLANYYEIVTGDMAKAIESYRMEEALFPNDSGALVNIAADYNLIGKPEMGLAPALRAVALKPVSPAYQTLIAIQLQLGKIEDAKATAEKAIRGGFDNEDMHHDLLHAAYVQNDLKGIEAQLDWSEGHPEAIKLHFDEILLVLTRGQRRKAMTLFGQTRASDDPSELMAQRQMSAATMARLLADIGLGTESGQLLRGLPIDPQDRDAQIALVESGETERVEREIHKTANEHGSETLWKNDALPEITAAILLARHQPQEAITALEPARQFDVVSFSPPFLRAKAYLQLHMPLPAQQELAKIIDHIYADTLSPIYPLAVLESARAYSASRDFAKSRQRYEKFFALWNAADADIPLLQAAKSEYGNLPAPNLVGMLPQRLRFGDFKPAISAASGAWFNNATIATPPIEFPSSVGHRNLTK